MGAVSRKWAGVSRIILPPLAMLLIVLGSSFQIPVASALWRQTLGVSCSIQVASPPHGGWDKSSLKFVGQGSVCDDGGTVFALVENGGRDMAGPADWELYLHKGPLQAAGSIPALKSGEVYAITANVVLPATYKFTAYQRPGHPGKGVLRSEEIVFDPQTCPALPAAAPPMIEEQSTPTPVPETGAPSGAPQETPTPESVQDEAPPPEPVETETPKPGATATEDPAGTSSATPKPVTPEGDPSISATPLPPAQTNTPTPVESSSVENTEPAPEETSLPEPAAEQNTEPAPVDLPSAEPQVP